MERKRTGKNLKRDIKDSEKGTGNGLERTEEGVERRQNFQEA